MREEFFGIFPVRGLCFSDARYPSLFDEDWLVVSAVQAEAIDAAIGLGGNLPAIRSRLRPDAFLLVRQWLEPSLNFVHWGDLANHAECLIGEINWYLLTQVGSGASASDRDCVVRMLPTPVWIPRFPEDCELPLIIDRSKVRMVGHSSPLNWAAWIYEGGSRITHREFSLESPCDRKPSGKHCSALRSLSRSHNAISIGQYVSQCLGVLDIMFGENDSTRWEAMQRYVTVVCGRRHKESVSRIFKIRHEYIHRHKEPSDMASHYKCLAFVTKTLISLFALEALYGQATLNVLEAADRLERASESSHRSEVHRALAEITCAFSGPEWVDDWVDAPVF